MSEEVSTGFKAASIYITVVNIYLLYSCLVGHTVTKYMQSTITSVKRTILTRTVSGIRGNKKILVFRICSICLDWTDSKECVQMIMFNDIPADR